MIVNIIVFANKNWHKIYFKLKIKIFSFFYLSVLSLSLSKTKLKTFKKIGGEF